MINDLTILNNTAAEGYSLGRLSAFGGGALKGKTMKQEQITYCTVDNCENEADISVKRIVGGCEIAVPLCSLCADAFNWGQETGFARTIRQCYAAPALLAACETQTKYMYTIKRWFQQEQKLNGHGVCHIIASLDSLLEDAEAAIAKA